MALWKVDIPSFAVPDFLNRPPTGRIELDLFPLITMFACAPTLYLFYIKGRYADVAAYSIGFISSIVYHMLALSAHNGLASVSFLGMHGAAWRTIDIMSANVLLARTMGHALAVDHPLIAMLPNVMLPVVLVVMLFTLGEGAMNIPIVSRVSMIVTGITMVLHLGKGGYDLVRGLGMRFNHARAMRAFTSIAAGMFCFGMPNRQPQNYWIWHSIWHLCMGLGYWDLYVHLLHKEEEGAKAKAVADPPTAESSAALEWLARQLSAEELKAVVADARAAVGSLAEEAGGLETTGTEGEEGAEPGTARGRQTPRRTSARKGASVGAVKRAGAEAREGIEMSSPAPARARSASKGRSKARELAALGVLKAEAPVEASASGVVAEAEGPRLRPRTRRQGL